jgi:hypothetical protein
LILSKDALEAANEFRVEFDTLTATFGAVANEIGIAFLPVAKQLVDILQNNVLPAVRSVVAFFSNLSDTTKTVIAVVAGLVAAIGPILITLGSLVKIIPLVTAGFTALGTAVTFATGPIGITVAAIAGLALGINSLVKSVKLSEETIQKQNIALNEFAKATQLANEAQGLLNKANSEFNTVSREATEQTKELIKAKIADVQASLAQAKAANEVAIAEARKITFLDKLETVFLPGLLSQQKRVNKVQQEGSQEIEKLNTLLNELTVNYFKIGTEIDKVTEKTTNAVGEFNKLEESTNNILERVQEAAIEGGASRLGILDIIIPNSEVITDFTNKVDEEFEKIEFRIQDLSGAFAGLGSLIGSTFNNIPLGNFIGQFSSFVTEVVAGLFAVAKANAVAGATQSSLFTGPAAVFTLPAFIATSVGLVASAFAGLKGGGSQGGGGASFGSASIPQDQTISGTGLGLSDPNREIRLVAETDGNKLKYVIDQSQFYSN